MGQYCPMACFPWSNILMQQPHTSRGVTAQSGLVPFYQLTKITPQKCLWANPIVAITQLRFPLDRYAQIYIKLTKTSNGRLINFRQNYIVFSEVFLVSPNNDKNRPFLWTLTDNTIKALMKNYISTWGFVCDQVTYSHVSIA